MPSHQQINVLIVDDSEIIAVRLKEIVQEIPFVSKIFIAEDYTGALSLIKTADLHIVLLDIFLHEESGIDLLKYIRTEYPSIKVVMVTNKPTDFNRILCNELGAHSFVDKTEEFEKIPEIIASLY